jgi:hypothetical protein
MVNIDIDIITDFIPIFIIFVFISYPQSFLYIANSNLGKLVAISIIIYYTQLNILYGILACVIIIWCYQYNIVNSSFFPEGFTDSLRNIHNISVDDESKLTILHDNISIVPPSDKIIENEPYIEYRPTIPAAKFIDNNAGDTIASNSLESRDKFQKTACRGSEIFFKEYKVRPEVVEFVYPELEFSNSGSCNPCDNNCAFSITDIPKVATVEKKLAAERDMTLPRSSNEWLDKVLLNIRDAVFSPMLSIGVQSEPFSIFR